MERFVNASEYDRQQAKEHARVIAFGALVAFFAAAGIAGVMITGGYSGLVFGLSLLAGLVAWGASYAIVYLMALPTEPGEWSDVQEREIEQTQEPPANEVKHQFTAVWDGRLRLGNTLVTIPPDVGEAAVKQVADARRKGHLETVSLRGLDGIGISRFATTPPNAQSVMKFLSRAGAIDSNGEWTRVGLDNFPSPITNGRMGSFAGGVSTDTTTTGPGGVSHRGVA